VKLRHIEVSYLGPPRAFVILMATGTPSGKRLALDNLN
jgi:hypothetical protein